MKGETLDSVRLKVGEVLVIEDILISEIELSPQLKNAIEAKMVQEQEASKAKYTEMKAGIDAQIRRTEADGMADATIIRAKADAESIRIRGEALARNPSIIELELVGKWGGKTPEFISGGGTSVLLPVRGK